MANKVGDRFKTNEGYDVEIIDYIGYHNCSIKFLYNEKVFSNIEVGNLKKGNVKNPYHPSVYGVGFVGEGSFKKFENNKNTVVYDAWNNLLKRCYSEVSLKKRPTYREVEVCKEWCNFQVFAEWYSKNHIEGWHLDKDILFKGNKVYSPETCCFVPLEINCLFIKSDKKRGELPIGVNRFAGKFRVQLSIGSKKVYIGLYDTPEEAFEAYKTAKEHQIKKLAVEYYSTGKISLKVYEAMYNYKVEITD